MCLLCAAVDIRTTLHILRYICYNFTRCHIIVVVSVGLYQVDKKESVNPIFLKKSTIKSALEGSRSVAYCIYLAHPFTRITNAQIRTQYMIIYFGVGTFTQNQFLCVDADNTIEPETRY